MDVYEAGDRYLSVLSEWHYVRTEGKGDHIRFIISGTANPNTTYMVDNNANIIDCNGLVLLTVGIKVVLFLQRMGLFVLKMEVCSDPK